MTRVLLLEFTTTVWTHVVLPMITLFRPRYEFLWWWWWQFEPRWARDDMMRRFSQPTKPFSSFFLISANRSGKCITTPLPWKQQKLHQCAKNFQLCQYLTECLDQFHNLFTGATMQQQILHI